MKRLALAFVLLTLAVAGGASASLITFSGLSGQVSGRIGALTPEGVMPTTTPDAST